MVYEDFLTINEMQGWDDLIEFIVTRPETIPGDIKDDILLFCKIYALGYDTKIYNETADPDYGICMDIRNFAITHIMTLLEDTLNGENK